MPGITITAETRLVKRDGGTAAKFIAGNVVVRFRPAEFGLVLPLIASFERIPPATVPVAIVMIKIPTGDETRTA